jgi:hypothetical protein
MTQARAANGREGNEDGDEQTETVSVSANESTGERGT